MDTLVLILIILLVVFAFGGFYTGRPGYSGAGAGMAAVLYALAGIFLVALFTKLLGLI